VRSLAACLDNAAVDARALALGTAADPLRLDLPPDGGVDSALDPRAAAVLGSLYLVGELEQLDVVASAELLATERWNLDLRDHEAAGALEAFARAMPGWPGATVRAQLFARLFGTAIGTPDGPGRLRPVAAPPNDVFEELLAGYAQALAAFSPAGGRRAAVAFQAAGDRLRANLAPRQYGNTMIVASALVDQLRASLDLLALDGIGAVFATSGVWNVLRALHGGEGGDIGRRVDRGRAGQTIVASTGYPSVPDLVESPLVDAATMWLLATGFADEAAAV
jgi:hypothetical protein